MYAISKLVRTSQKQKLSDLSYYRRFSPKIILLITLIVGVLVATLSIVIVNTIVHDWGIYEIFTSLGTSIGICGGILAYISFSGGTQVSNFYLHSRYTKMAHVENEYARKRRQKAPWLSFLIIIIGGIFIAIGLIGLL